jgi:Cof subfamily protein (haloacid dehalogenase superfamily)
MSSLLTSKPNPLPSFLDDPELLRPFAAVRMIVFDLDGTLVREGLRSLGARLAELFSTVSAGHVPVALATGRTLAGVEGILGQLSSLRRVPLVLYNGSVVVSSHGAALIACSGMSSEVVAAVVDLARSVPDAAAYVYCIDETSAMLDTLSGAEAVFYVGPHERPARDFNGMEVQPLSVSCLRSTRSIAVLLEIPSEGVRRIVRERLCDIRGISVTSSGGKYIEVRPEGTSKATGVRRLADGLHINARNVLAIGDNDNDVELLKWAGLSVCVDEASAAARAASTFFSTLGAGNAAIEILEVVRRARRLYKGATRSW